MGTNWTAMFVGSTKDRIARKLEETRRVERTVAEFCARAIPQRRLSIGLDGAIEVEHQGRHPPHMLTVMSRMLRALCAGLSTNGQWRNGPRR
jgi:hypothetical protein